MNLRFIRNPQELEGTGYIEFLPGSFYGDHWGPDSIFFTPETFELIEPTIQKHVANYNPYGPSEVDEEIWQIIITDFEDMQRAVRAESPKIDFALFLEDLVSWLKDTLGQTETISILGL